MGKERDVHAVMGVVVWGCCALLLVTWQVGGCSLGSRTPALWCAAQQRLRADLAGCAPGRQLAWLWLVCYSRSGSLDWEISELLHRTSTLSSCCATHLQAAT